VSGSLAIESIRRYPSTILDSALIWNFEDGFDKRKLHNSPSPSLVSVRKLVGTDELSPVFSARARLPNFGGALPEMDKVSV
jgi:hypothetical protein